MAKKRKTVFKICTYDFISLIIRQLISLTVQVLSAVWCFSLILCKWCDSSELWGNNMTENMQLHDKTSRRQQIPSRVGKRCVYRSYFSLFWFNRESLFSFWTLFHPSEIKADFLFRLILWELQEWHPELCVSEFICKLDHFSLGKSDETF